jgi:hypothetical protein
VGFTLEGREGLGFTGAEEDPDARHPVGAFSVDEVGDDFGGCPSGGGFGGLKENSWKGREERVEDRGCDGEDGDRA